MSRLLLLSTYELGARPLGCTVPAAHLGAAGHGAVAVDLAVEPWPADRLAEVDGVVLSVPMHTAWRLGLGVVERLRAERPELPLFLHGLYAEAAADAAADLLGPGDVAASGEVAAELVAWADRLGRPAADGPRRRRTLGPARPGPRPAQARAGLPGLDAYAVLHVDGETRLVGTLESSTGCNHRCRHCPVPAVYGGRSRAVALEAVMADAAALVAEGARHLHLADPDFLNRPAHAAAFAQALAGTFPAVTFDATIKVSHLLRHEGLVGELATCGMRFVISALESTSDTVLARLDKGHTADDGRRAVRLLRRCGVEPRPSFLPFTPWTTRDDVVALLDFVAAEDLVWNVDAVQYGIRLLLPPGSLLLDEPDPALAAALTGADPEAGGTGWLSGDPALDHCQAAVAACAETLEAEGAGAEAAYEAVRATALDVLGRSGAGRPAPAGLLGPPGPLRPRLSESWFCCAEPTGRQRGGVGTGGGAGCSAQAPVTAPSSPRRRPS